MLHHLHEGRLQPVAAHLLQLSGQCLLGLGDPSAGCESLQQALIQLGYERSHVTAGASAEEKELNAKYAVSSARKLGCSLFCTWEDIVDARPKMVLSFVATVMSFSCLGRAPTVRK